MNRATVTVTFEVESTGPLVHDELLYAFQRSARESSTNPKDVTFGPLFDSFNHSNGATRIIRSAIDTSTNPKTQGSPRETIIQALMHALEACKLELQQIHNWMNDTHQLNQFRKHDKCSAGCPTLQAIAEATAALGLAVKTPDNAFVLMGNAISELLLAPNKMRNRSTWNMARRAYNAAVGYERYKLELPETDEQGFPRQ